MTTQLRAITDTVVFCVLGLIVGLCGTEVGWAEEPVVERAAPDNVPVEEPPVQEQEQRRQAYAALLAVVGIAIVGITMVAVIILWAGRLRRINRQPRPTTRPQDELWFLKPPKEPVSPTGPTDRQHSDDD